MHIKRTILSIALSLMVTLTMTPFTVLAEQGEFGAEQAAHQQEQVSDKPAADVTGELEADGQTDETVRSDPAEPETVKEEEPTKENVTFTKELDAKGELSGIKIIARADKDAFPEGTAMTVKREDIKSIRDDVIDDLGRLINLEAAVDITFHDADGREVQPASDVEVKFEAGFIEKDEEAVVIHIDHKGKCAEKDVLKQNEGSLMIETGEFSVYAVGYTVDFIFSGLQYSITGGSTVKLSSILDKLDTGLDTDLVREVAFSAPSLIEVARDGVDWTLTSLKPFKTEEVLTLTLKDDSTVRIKVTDAEVKYTGTSGGVTWTIDAAGNMVFRPTNGVSGIMNRFHYGYLTAEQRDAVKTISFDSGVKANSNCQSMFRTFTNLVSADLTNLDTSDVTNMAGMFYQCTSLQEIDVSSMNTSSVTDMQSMFRECRSLKKIDATNWDTKEVTNMKYMFTQCTSLQEINVSDWDTKKTTDMSYMFYQCTPLQEIDVSNWNTSSVTDMQYMFYQCRSLQEIDVSNWDTSSVTNMQSMFRECRSLQEIDVSDWDTKEVTSMRGMFASCVLLEELKLPSDTDGSKITDMTNIFTACKKLESIDLSGIRNISALTGNGAASMFQECESLKNLDLSTLDITNCAFFGHYFQSCNSLEELTIGNGFIFKQGTEDEQQSTGFPKGLWLRDEDGQQYTSTELVALLEHGSMPGTYTRVNKRSLYAGFPVDYKITDLPVPVFDTDGGIYKYRNNRVITYVDGSSLEGDDCPLPGSFSLTFPDNVEDAYGNKYSLEMKYEDIVLHDAKSVTYNGNDYSQYYPTLFVYGSDGIPYIDVKADAVVGSGTVSASTTPTVEYKITLTVLDTRGNPVDGHFIYSLYDLDTAGPLDYGKEGSISAPSSILPNQAYGEYSEGLYLGDGFDIDTITMADNTYLWDIGVTDKGYRITGTQLDGGSELSDLIVRADASGSTFIYTGYNCVTYLLSDYQPNAVSFDKVDQYEERLNGAELALYRIMTDSDGTETVSDRPLETWTSDSTKEHDFSTFLPPGKYVVKETGVPLGYEKAEDKIFIIDADYDLCDEDGNKLDIGNIVSVTDKLKETEATIKKAWNDCDNQDGKRPERLIVTLSNGTETVAEETLSEENNWTATVEHLPQYSNGKKLEYTWNETGLAEDYELTDTSVDGTVTTLTNSLVTEATVRKVWNDDNNANGMRPGSLSVILSNGDKLTLSESGRWEATIKHLQKYDGKKVIEYTWTEEAMPKGYKLTGIQTDGTVTTLTNTFTPQTESLTPQNNTSDTFTPDIGTSESNPKSGNGVKTGDDTQIGLLIALMLMSAAGFTAVALYRRKDGK